VFNEFRKQTQNKFRAPTHLQGLLKEEKKKAHPI